MTGRWPRPDLASRQSPVYAHAWAQHNERVLHEPGPLWVALGDSLTQGVGASAWDRGWVHQAQRELARRGHPYRVLNLSSTGASTLEVLRDQLPALEDLPQSPDVITVLIGSNDIRRTAARGQLLARYTTILSRLPRASVVALLPQPVPLAGRVNQEIQRAATTAGIHPVNLRPVAVRMLPHRAADLFHPNDRGHQYLAEAFVHAILAVGQAADPA